MLTELDQRTLAYCNLFAVLGTLPQLCQWAPEAGALLEGKPPISIGFQVKNGPQGTLRFRDGGCRMEQGCEDCVILLRFATAERFNGLIDGTVTPVPARGLTKVGFLLKTFVPLTDVLSKYLRPTPEALEDPEFRALSTRLTLMTAAEAVSQVANHDESGRFSAGNMPDGEVALEVQGDLGVTIQVRDHRLTTIKAPCDAPRARMRFESLDTLGDLLSGRLSGIAGVCSGRIAMEGMLDMIDNINRILDRVSRYLA